jgi:hypothetical protein
VLRAIRVPLAGNASSSGIVNDVEPSSAVTDSKCVSSGKSYSTPWRSAPLTGVQVPPLRVSVSDDGKPSQVPASRVVELWPRISLKLDAEVVVEPLFAIAVRRYVAPENAASLGASSVLVVGVRIDGSSCNVPAAPSSMPTTAATFGMPLGGVPNVTLTLPRLPTSTIDSATFV